MEDINSTNNNHTRVNSKRVHTDYEELNIVSQMKKARGDTDDKSNNHTVDEESNIDSELLGENTHGEDSGNGENYGDNSQIQDNENVAAAAAAAAAVSATYDELLQHSSHGNEHNNVDVSLDDSDIGHKAPDNHSESIRDIKLDVDDNEDDYSSGDKDKSVDDSADSSQLQGSTGTSLNDIDEARKRLARRGRKPAPITGTDEWKQQRRDSHKEVERRRRESINQAINSLSLLLPVKESSKAAILARAAEYIEKLKETENANIEKWTLQKLLSEQHSSQLATANEKLQGELGNTYKEIEHLKRLLKKNGIKTEEDDNENNDNSASPKKA